MNSVDTLQEALKDREQGHVVCLFGCDHWFDVCVEILQREGFEEYTEDWSLHPDVSHCRCVWEDDPLVVLIDDDCPVCEIAN